jgi:outer membrane receptor protein involved in Fe transport
MQRKLLFLLLITALVPGLMFASGKIKGKVVDAGSGEPLVGANVVVVGTSMGAASNVSGEYTVLNIPAGTYTLKTSYVGYQAVTLSNIRVNDDLTTDANFQLPAEGVTVATVEIVAQRPLVNKSATNAVRIIDNEFFGNIPGRGTNIALAIQPGVVIQNNNIYIRGSRPDEVGFYVDGVNVTNMLGGGNGLYTTAEAVEQIQVQAGGYNAEFGSANAGIISSQLRTGNSERWRGSLLVETDRYASYGKESLSGYSYGYSDLTATFGGPVFSNKLRLFGSVQNTFRRDQNQSLRTPFSFANLVTDPVLTPAHPASGAARADTIPLYSVGGNILANPDNRWAFAGTMVVDLDKLQIRAGGSYSYDLNSSGTTFANYLNQGRVQSNLTRDGFANVKASYLFSPTTFLEVNGDWYSRTTNNTDPYWGWDLFSYGDSAANAAKGWYLQRQGLAYPAYSFYNGSVSGMNQPGTPAVNAPYRDRMQTFGGRLDFSTQINRHLIKAGGELSVSKYRRYNPAAVVSWASLAQQAHSSAELERTLMSNAGPGSDLIGYDIFGNEVNSDVVVNGGTYYFAPPKPVLGAVYVQDKIELSDIILNLGLRWDYINPDSRTTTDPGNLTYNADNLLAPSNFQKTPTTSVLSPRIGFSFPVTDRTVFHAQYGRFIQSARLNDSYAGPSRIAATTKTGNWVTAVTGWGLLPEKDTQYELGFGEAISDNASFDVTAFYKDVRDQIQFVVVAPEPNTSTQQYHAMANKDFSTSKGIEFVFTLHRTSRVSAQMNYTFSDAGSTASDQVGSNGIWQLGLGPNALPKYVFPVNFNQAHRGSVILDYRFGKNDGGPILQQLGANMLFSFNSGHSYTRLDVQQRGPGPGIAAGGDSRFRIPLEPIGASTSPWFFELDMRLDKTVTVGSLDLNIYIYAINLLGTNNPINAFVRTGDPNSDGYLQTQGGIADVQTLGPGFAPLYTALNNGINQGNFGPPRQFRFGLKLDY